MDPNKPNQAAPNAAQNQQLTVKDFFDKPTIYEINGEEVKLTPNIIKSYLVRGDAEVTDSEVVAFLNLCKYQKLNPFLNEAFLVKYKGIAGDRATIITSKEFFMKRAYDCPNYDGMEAGVVVQKGEVVTEIQGALVPTGQMLIGGWARVFVKDKTHPTYVQVAFSEFSKGQATWKAMPATMIRKVAVVNALREAFPKEFGGLYTEDEPGFSREGVIQSVKQDAIAQTGNTPIPPKGEPKNEPKKDGISDEEAARRMEADGQQSLPIEEGPGF